MAIWRHGLLGAVLAGAIWASVWQVIVIIMLILMTGAGLSLQVGSAMLAGMAAGVAALFYRPSRRWLRHVIGGLVLAALLWGFALGSPFDSQGLLPVWQNALALFVMAAAGWFCIVGAIGPMQPELQTRYLAERFYLRLLWGLGLVLFVLMVAIPFYIMVMTSLKSQQSLLVNPLDFSIDFQGGAQTLLRSYIELFTDYNFGALLLNTAIVSVVTVMVTLLFSVPGAYAVAKLRFPGRKWLSGSVLLIYLIPAIILVIPLYSVFSQLGLRNSLLGLCIVYPATTIPVALYMLRGYFAGLPSELDDAGLMDGLSRLQIIVKIAMPLSMPAIASVALYVFMIAWNEFLFAFMFLDDVQLFTLSRGIVSLNSSEVPRQHLMAGAVIATTPVLIIFLWFERFLVSGLTAGSVKG
jgi:multiple sugar transport system permease protein